MSFGHWLFAHWLLFVIWCLVIGICGCQSRSLYKESRIMMGTFVEVTSPDSRAADIVFAELKRIENLLSKYKPDSEVSLLNKSGELEVSPETLYLFKKAGEFYSMSQGAFDITIGALLDLWGFTDKKYYLPKDEEIKDALNLVGFDKIIFNIDNNMIKFDVQGMKIDLGAIAKGYSVDCAIKKLKKEGISSCLINAGGDIYCLGYRFGRPWRVSIKDPQAKGLLESLELKNKAVASSGDYEQYFIKDKERFAHIFNPKTGYPVESGMVSVTVIASDCLTADALATAVFVLGKKKGLELIKKYPDVKVKLIEKND